MLKFITVKENENGNIEMTLTDEFITIFVKRKHDFDFKKINISWDEWELLKNKINNS